MSEGFLSFKLPEDFIEEYKNAVVPWGFDIGGGNSLGELTYITKYSRRKEDGTKERWHESCRRVIEGTWSILKDHCKGNRTPWNEQKAQRTAQDAFDRMFNLKWTPPGRGIWMMGTEFVHKSRNSAALQNCSFISSEKLSSHSIQAAILPFIRLMEMSMLGVGVGFDTKGANKLTIHQPTSETEIIVIEDTREGWYESVGRLLESYFFPNRPQVEFDYSLVRPAGEIIRGFGGVASGPAPLIDLHVSLHDQLRDRDGQSFSATDIVDVCNKIGKCVVAGNVRRCLPEGALVQTVDGVKPIESLTPRDIIITSEGEAHVSKLFDQGIQKTIKIQHQFGSLECTPLHQVATLVGVDKVEYKMAGDLAPGDLLAWDPVGYDGVETRLPELSWEYSSKDHTGQRVVIPELDEGVAWLIGQMHGDGYVFVPGANAKTPNGYVSVAVSPDSMDQAEELVVQFAKFNVNAHIKQSKWDKAIRVNVYSNVLANWMFENIKKPKQELRIPDFILNGHRSIRESYLAGLFDADGSYGRPVNLLSTVYLSLANDVRVLCAGLGFPVRVDLSRKAQGNWQALYKVSVVGMESLHSIHNGVGEFSFKWQGVDQWRSAGGAHYPSEMVREQYKGKWITNGFVTTDRIKKQGIELTYLPIEVVSLKKGREVQTYDIEVEGIHSFVHEGFLVHNSAEISLGAADDKEFLNLKNYEANPERAAWGWASNNSVITEVGGEYEHLFDRIADNGEPGILYLDLCRKFGRLVDPPTNRDYRVVGTNPCSEQSLESLEMCTLVETFPHRHENIEDYLKTIKVSYLYGKAVTLLPTHWPETNEIMQRNRRIGCSMSGLAQFAENRGWTELRTWMNTSYDAVKEWDRTYSEWLGVRESVKTTSIKPSGTVSLLAGATPGVHWPTDSIYIRRMRLANNDPIIQVLEKAGYKVEPAEEDPKNTSVVELPTRGPDVRTEKEVSIWEKTSLAILAQRYWADNQVSVTVSFKPEEKDQIGPVLRSTEGQLKSVSFLPMLEVGGAYAQMPYESITEEAYDASIRTIKKVNWKNVYDGGKALDAEGEKYCSNDTCEI